MLKGKVVAITGGAGLLGQEFASAIATREGIPVLCDKNEQASLGAVEKLQKKNPGAEIGYFKVDISDRQSILDLISDLSSKYGKVDALVNNAYPRNKNYGRKFEDVTYEDFCDNLGINLGGCFLASQQFISYFIKQGYGNIINIASVYGVIAPRFEVYDNTPMTMPVEYAAIKSGLIHLTKYMAKYCRGKNVRVNSISPGGIFADQPQPFLNSYKDFCLNKGMLDKSDINGTLIYLLSDLSEFVNGQNIIVDDGFTL